MGTRAHRPRASALDKTWRLTLQLAGLLLVVLGLVAPRWAQAGPASSPAPMQAQAALDGGACGAAESRTSIDCAPTRALDEPALITLLRAAGLRASEEQCRDLLADIWDQQVCRAGSRDCGKLVPGAVPGPGPKLSSSPSSGYSLCRLIGLGAVAIGRLALPSDDHLPTPRDISPPKPPPRLLAC